MKIKLLILLISLLEIGNAQPPNYLWAKKANGSSSDYPASITTDASGNILITGTFTSPTISFGTTTLNNAGGYDIFISKYDALGNVLWAKSAGKSSADKASSITTDSSGNIYIAGYFNSSTLTFGSTTLTNTDNTGQTFDMFITKYDASGNVLWAKQQGGSYDDIIHSITADTSGNIYATGHFHSPTVAFGSTILTNVSGDDMFITKYDALGNAIWAKSTGGNSWDEALSITIDKKSNIYVTGDFLGTTLKFGSITLTNSGANSKDIFIAKYDASGNIIWAKSAGGSSDDYATDLTTDILGNICVSGFFGSPTIAFGSTILTNAGTSDAFITQYDTLGNINWAKSVGGSSFDYGSSVITDTYGNIYIAGEFASPTITLGSTTLTNAGNVGTSDIFIAKYDVIGNVSWLKGTGGNSNDEAISIATDASNSIYVTGDFESPSLTFGSTTLSNSGAYNVFTAKLEGVLGIDELSNLDNLSMYPNPFSSTTTFQTDMFFKNASLTVYNSVGQTVKRIGNLAGQTVIFHRDNLPSGLYFVRLTQDSQTLSADKFVIVDE